MPTAKFKLKRRRGTTIKPLFRRADDYKDPADQPPFFIRGIQAGSKEEWWVALALMRIEKAVGYTWEYQVPVFGGRTRSGGNVVDFIVNTPIIKTWLDPMGSYWHTGRREDRDQMMDAARKKGAVLIAWFTDETPSKEIMYSFLRNKLGV